jgi:hypothetical protein
VQRLKAWRPGRLGWALIVSLLAHVTVLFGGEIDLQPRPDLQRLEAKLVRAAPDIKVGQAAQQEKPPKAPVPKKKPPVQPETAVAEAKDPPREAKPEEVKQPEPEPEIVAPPEEEVPPSPAEPPQALGSNWPKRGRITYMVLMGDQRIGRQTSEKSKAVIEWSISPEAKYDLRVDMTIADIPYMPFFKLNLNWLSRGQINEHGLQPVSFSQELAFADVKAAFDWQAMTVNVNGQTLPLVEGTQDLASLLLQIGYPGMIEKGSMPLATERRVEAYPIQLVGEVQLQLPFKMTWRTLHLQIPNERSKLKNVWIAPDYFGLPVQIELNWKGVKYYLVATEVLVDQESQAKARAKATANPAQPPSGGIQPPLPQPALPVAPSLPFAVGSGHPSPPPAAAPVGSSAAGSTTQERP